MSSLSSIGGALNSPPGTGSALTSPSSSTGTLSVGGLITGLNTSQIIQGLLAVQAAQISTVQAHESAVTQREVAYKSLQAKLLAFQGSVTGLAQAYNGPFDGRTATSSDPTLVTAAASGGAVPGTYSLKVNALAQANEIASQGFDSLTAKVTHGTLTVGSGSTSATVTVDATNDTLQGLAAAINGANAGVTATVVNDGRSHPYRLLLTANTTGTANAVSLTNNLAASGGGAVRPVFNANAIGSAVAAPGNTGTAAATSGGAFTGTTNNTYTLTVTGGGTVGTTNGITLSYADSTGAHTGTVTINSGDLNALKAVAEGVQVAFGAGTLAVGDKFTIDTTVPTVQQAADASVTLGSGPGALTVTNPGNALNNVINGVTLNLAGADPTKAVQVTVANDTGAAKQAVQNFVTAYNGVISTIANDISYDPGTKKAGVLLGDPSIVGIEDQLRGLATSPVAGANPKLSSLSALGITGDDGGQLQINDAQLTRVLSGQVGSGTSLALGPTSFLGFGAAASATGQDVAGSFLVNGASEAATGGGQVLTGKAGNANTDGLAVRVSLLDSQLSPGPSTPVANLGVSHGVAAQLGDVLNGLLDPVSGRLQTIDKGFQDQIAAYQKTIDRLNRDYTARQNQLTRQFVQLEATVNQLKTAGNFLTAQTAALLALAPSSTGGTH